MRRRGCSAIRPLLGIDLFEPKIQNAAKFALEDYNKKFKTNLELVRVEKAASTACGSTITYLTLQAKANDNYKLFKTAVWERPWTSHSVMSVGLEYVSEAFSEQPPAAPPLPPPPRGLRDYPEEFKSAGKLAIEHHNRKNQTQLELLDVVHYGLSRKNEYTEYSLTLLAQNEIKKHMVFQTEVTTHHLNNFTESPGLNCICEVQPRERVPDSVPAPEASDKKSEFISVEERKRRLRQGTYYLDPEWISPEFVSTVNATFVAARINEHEIEWTRQISAVASNLCEIRFRKEFYSFLTENNYNLDHYKVARKLKAMIPYVAGKAYAHVLLTPLESLCAIESLAIRSKGVELLCQIGEQMNQSDLQNWFVPLVKRLAASEHYACRLSSCGLFHIAYPDALENMKTELRLLYTQLSQDEMPVVRRNAASNLGKFAATIEASYIETIILSIFKELVKDDEISVQVAAVQGYTTVWKLLKAKDCVPHLVPVIEKLSQNKSRVIRCRVAEQLDKVTEAKGLSDESTIRIRTFIRKTFGSKGFR